MKCKWFSYEKTKTKIDEETTEITHDININISDHAKSWIVFITVLIFSCTVIFISERLL